MYWSACISTWDSSSLSRSERGIWITFVIAASPLIAIATSPLRAAGALDGAAHGLADRLGIDDRLLVDRVRRRGLGRVGLHAIGITAPRKLDELDRGSGDVEPDYRFSSALKQHR
jgi:hypothetical protein